MTQVFSNTRKRFRVVRLGALLAVALTIAWVFLVRERWTTSTTEFKTIMKYYRPLEQLQGQHFATVGRYGTLGELRGLSGGRLEHVPATGCDPQYCVEVEAVRQSYSIRVFPNAAANVRRYLSIYADQRRAIHIAFGQPRAGPTSRVLPPDEVARLEK